MQFLAFGRFTVDPARRLLYEDGAPVPVSQAGLRLLLALVESRGSLVSKDDLLARVWGAGVVTDNALQVQIAMLRKLVGDQFILTKRGAGYRFVGQVQATSTPVSQPRAQRSRAIPPNRGGAILRLEQGERARRSKLPAATGLVGRDGQLREILTLLRRARFVTLTGPGGVGKTSLAQALVPILREHFPDGVWWVELAAQRDAAAVVDTVKAALNIEGGFDAQPLADLLARVQSKRALLLLDNCEHLLSTVAQIATALFASAPGLAILATSRQPLGCTGEHIFDTPMLSLPDPDVTSVARARRAPAFQLFADRIMALNPKCAISDGQTALAARICRRLDGLPLALEIAAGWVSVLGLEALEAKLEAATMAWPPARLTAPARHRALNATLAWSHDLLSPAEQAVLRRMAVFAHAFTLDAAEPVAADASVSQDSVFAHLGSLVQKSLVVFAAEAQPPAYRLLETTRAFALERLRAAGEEDLVRRRHAAYLLGLLAAAEAEWDTISGVAWLARYRALVAEVRGALDWAIGKGADPALGVSIAAVSWPLWRELSLRVEGAQRLAAALQHLPPGTSPALVAQLRYGLGVMYTDRGDMARVEFAQAVALFREIGDRHRLCRALQHLAFALSVLGEIDAADRASIEGCAIGEEVGSQRALATGYDIQMIVHIHHGRLDAARDAARRAERLYEAAGADRSVFSTRSNMVELALAGDDEATAIHEGRALAERLRGTPHVDLLCLVLARIVAALVRTGQHDEALRTAREAATMARETRQLILLLDHLALHCAMTGRLADAAMLAGYADRAYAQRGWPRQSAEQSSIERARALLQALPEGEPERLARDGACLTEANAWALAARGTTTRSAPDDAAGAG